MPREPELSDAAAAAAVIDVVVGIVTDSRGRALIGRRQSGKHMAGAWEFPGGKLEAGEAPIEGLRRELGEEIGIAVETAEKLVEHSHQYPDRKVRLDVWWVVSYAGTVRACEAQELSWVAVDALAQIDMLPADAPIVDAVRRRLAGH